MLLAVDTSTAQTGLALYDGAQLRAEILWHSRAHHTQELAPAFAGLLERAGAKPPDLTALAVAIGPGSFSSLRVGLAFVKGLALARHLPLVGIPTLDVTAAAITPEKTPLVAVLQAGRGRIAAAWYKATRDGPSAAGSWGLKESARVTTVEALGESIQSRAIVCGELSAAERALLRSNGFVRLASPAACVRRPGLLAELAWARWQAGEVDSLASLAPIYLHIAEPIGA
jgi:tRNA threonylcarbamoyladenosine biosynthesis protein TsaB